MRNHDIIVLLSVSKCDIILPCIYLTFKNPFFSDCHVHSYHASRCGACCQELPEKAICGIHWICWKTSREGETRSLFDDQPREEVSGSNKNICDVIKQNELELANTVFKIQPNKADSFFCFLLFVQSLNCLYLWNQFSNLCGVFIKLKPKQYPNRKCPKNQNHIFRLQTCFAWSHHMLWIGIHDLLPQNLHVGKVENVNFLDVSMFKMVKFHVFN